MIEDLEDELWCEDTVTGNGCYWYDSEENCSEYLCHNLDLAYEAAMEFNPDNEITALLQHYENKELARYLDCTIRCYLLYDCVHQACKEL